MKLDIECIVFDKKYEYNYCLYSSPFRMFYNINGDGKTPKSLSFEQHKNIPDYILELFKAFYQAYRIFTEILKLKNPLKEGVYFEKGARFIDIHINNIPVQKGLVAAQLVDNSKYFEKQELLGKAIKIQVHNDLIKNTATPIHELFHVFQYNYCNFNNMWFMEGLARWAQNLTHKRKMVDETLPQNMEQLDFLFSRAHDTEYFFRKLLSKFKQKKEFIKEFLIQCEIEDKKLQEKKEIVWTKELKKDNMNNQYILIALLDTINKFEKIIDSELEVFIQTIENYILEKEEITKENIVSEFIVKNKNDLKELETIDIINGDLIIENTDITSLNSLNKLKKVNTLRIKNNEYLREINGFNGLEYIKNLEISRNNSLIDIYGFFKFFSSIKTIEGYIKIEFNKNLTSVTFLKGLKSVGNSFYLHNNNLLTLEGLDNLEEVNASLSLSSNKLKSLEHLSNLKKLDGMLGIAYNNLVSLNGIQNLKEISVTKWNNQYRSLVLQGNKNLYDISALNCKSSSNHLIVYMDERDSYLTPKDNSEFYNQTIKVYQNDKIKKTQEIFNGYKKGDRVKILFYDTWNSALEKVSWLEAHNMHFEDVKELIKYAKKSGIEYLYGQVYRAQKFLFQNEKELKENGFKFIANNLETIRVLISKRNFYNFMEDNNFSELIPKYYKKYEDIKFPCVSKHHTHANGDSVKISNSFEELGVLDDDYVINEYIVSDTEYATNIFFKDEILYEVTFKKRHDTDTYVLNQETKYKLSNEVIECPFKKEFSLILKKLCSEGEYLTCCFDYKIKDGLPKIFEINVRFGYTLVRFENEFKSMMDVYIKECNNA